MSVIYWSIPLYLLAIAVAVVPVAYGSVKHQQWAEAAERIETVPLVPATDVPSSAAVAAAPTGQELSYDEALALISRLEQLSERWAPEAREPAAVSAA